MDLKKTLSPGLLYAHELLFNCWLFQPDESVEGFVRKYIPLLRPRDLNAPGGWTTYPPPENQKPRTQVIHMIAFRSHPYFTGNYLNGNLSFSVYEQDNQLTGIDYIETWLHYDSDKLAEADLSSLCMSFEKAGFLKETDMVNSVRRVTFHSENEQDLNYKPQFHLVRDYLLKGIIKIRFSFGFDDYIMM